MKSCIKIAVVMAGVCIPYLLMAQTPSVSAPGYPEKQHIDTFSGSRNPHLKLAPLPNAESNLQAPFPNHLPSALQCKKRKLFTDRPQRMTSYYYNMPVIKPGNTTEILVARLDANFPYSYGMPVKRTVIIER